MAKLYESIDERLRAFIEAQPMFSAATAPGSGGHLNVSPKGYQDTFAEPDHPAPAQRTSRSVNG